MQHTQAILRATLRLPRTRAGAMLCMPHYACHICKPHYEPHYVCHAHEQELHLALPDLLHMGLSANSSQYKCIA
eukprot:1156985-Pelagomonas_calceolata.AAC.2